MNKSRNRIFKIIITSFIVFNVYANEIEYFTTGHDAFSGWDVYQNKYLSFGVPNTQSSISGYQHKIHDSKGTFTDNLEYFCDPDDIIVISSDFGKQKHYVSYLPFKNDFFLSNKKDFFKATFLTEVKLVNDLDNNVVEIKIEKSFGENDNYITTKVHLHNLSHSKIDVAWIAQDAAFMSFKNNNQKSVIPFSLVSDKEINTRFFSEINIGDVIGTKHTQELNIGSYSPIKKPDNCKIYGGVIDEYAFFATHTAKETTKQQYPYGYADVSRASYGNLKNLKKYFKKRKFNNDNLKNRILLFECKNIEPEKITTLEYRQIAEHK